MIRLTYFLIFLQNNETVKLASFEKYIVKNASQFQWKLFEDETLKREFQILTDIGTSALDDEKKLNEVSHFAKVPHIKYAVKYWSYLMWVKT